MIEPDLTSSRLPDALGTGRLTFETLRHNTTNAGVDGIWRVRSDTGSAILKRFRPGLDGYAGYWPTSDEPSHWNHWRREMLAYTSGLAETAYEGIAPAPLLGSGEHELWLGDVVGAEGFGWSVPRLARFAYELGVGQARWADRVPDHPWLSRRWLAQYLAEGPARSVRVESADWDHPTLSIWPERVRADLRDLWQHRDRALAAAEASQRTLCHLDVWPANLIDVDGSSVLLDWAFVGEGGIGEDLSNLILDSFGDGLMDIALLPELADETTAAYLRGLRDGGWTGSDDDVRAAVAACGAAKYAWFAPSRVGVVARGEVGKSNYATDSSVEQIVARTAPLVTQIANWYRATA
jgi:hypothetical protein